MWEIQVYPNSNYPTEYNELDDSDKGKIDSLLEQLIAMDDPEDHNCAADCPSIPQVYSAVKYQNDNVVLIIALDRIMGGTEFEVDVISLYSCSSV